MTIKYCDRCKKEIKTKHLFSIHLPNYSITKHRIEGFDDDNFIDLCQECQKELDNIISKWLEGDKNAMPL